MFALAIEMSDLTSTETSFISKSAIILNYCQLCLLYRVICKCTEQISLPTISGVNCARQDVAEILRREQRMCLSLIKYQVESATSQLN